MKQSPYNNLKEVDYKDVELLKSFLDPHGRIMSNRKTHIPARTQRKLAVAIKRARFLALIPYIAG